MAEPLEYYRPPTQRPAALTAVAWLFIAMGILAIVEVIVGLFSGRFSLNLAILGVFIGRGLLNLRGGWRTCALVFTWFGLIVIPLMIIVALTSGGHVRVNVFGARTSLPATFVCLPLAGFFALSLWQYRVLTRPDTRAMFR